MFTFVHYLVDSKLGRIALLMIAVHQTTQRQSGERDTPVPAKARPGSYRGGHAVGHVGGWAWAVGAGTHHLSHMSSQLESRSAHQLQPRINRNPLLDLESREQQAKLIRHYVPHSAQPQGHPNPHTRRRPPLLCGLSASPRLGL